MHTHPSHPPLVWHNLNLIEKDHLTGVLGRTVVNNSLSQDFNHLDDHFQSRFVTPGFKPFSYLGMA